LSYIPAQLHTSTAPIADPDTLATTDEEIFLEAAERLRISIEAMGENVSQGIEALEFVDLGAQWPTDLANQRKIDRRPSLTINRTKTMVRRVVNNMRQQRPRIKVHPVADADNDKADKVGGMIRHIENLSNASIAYDTAGESAVKIGWGYLRIMSDWVSDRSHDQELKIVSIRNTFTVYEDPSCKMPTGQDRDWLLISTEISRKDYKKKCPKADNAEWRKGGAGDDGKEWESKEKIRLAEYYRVNKTSEWLYKLTDGTSCFESELPAQTLAGAMVARDPVTNEPVRRRSMRRTIEWFKLNGSKIVDYQVQKGVWIPVVRCLGNLTELNGKIYLQGMVRDLMDANRMYNYWRTCETELVALAPRAPFMVAEGQTDGHPEWKDANQKPYSTLTWKPVHSNPDEPDSPILPPPTRLEPPAIPAAVVGAAQGAEHDMMALAGMEHEPGQDKPGEVISGIALRNRQAMSDIGHFQYYDNQTLMIAHVGEILLDLIPYYYDEARQQRIVGDDGTAQMIGINQPGPQGVIQNDMKVGRYDVVMDTGPGYETKRQEDSEKMVALMGVGPMGEVAAKSAPDLVFRTLGFEQIADRLLPQSPEGMKQAMEQLPKQAQAIVTAQQTQIQQLQEQLKQAHLEIKYKSQIEHDWMDTDIRKTHMQTAVKAHDTEMKTHTDVHRQVLGDITKRDVAEINAGAKLIDSNNDRTHEKELAEMTAKAAEKAEKSNGSA
jgi:portal protein